MKGEAKEHKGDGYVVDIIPPAKSTPYPMVYVCPRKKIRKKGELALDTSREKFLKVSSNSFDTTKINETANLIGRTILDDSGIIKEYKGHRSQQP